MVSSDNKRQMVSSDNKRQMVSSDNKLGNCDDGSAYARVEFSLILKRSCPLSFQFCDVSVAKDIQTWQRVEDFVLNKWLYEWLFLKIKQNCYI